MTTRTLFPVQGPNQKSYSARFQTEASYASPWERLLREWRAGKGTVHCLCQRAHPVPLVLRLHGNGDVTLARHPHTGPHHDAACRYFGPSVSGAIAHAYETGVIKEDDGLYKIRLAVGRTMQEPRDTVAPVEDRPRRGPGMPRQRAMTALGLLKLLWEIAALHEYRPAWEAARAKAASVAGLLLAAADSVRWGGRSLADGLQMGSAFKTGRLTEHNRQVAAAARAQGTRLVILGRLKPYGAGAEKQAIDLVAGKPVPLRGWECARPILSDGHARGLQRSFDRELQAWRQGATTYAILIAEPQTDESRFDLVQIALMRVSPRAIPLDSGYEADVEEALAAKERRFDKPMRYVEGDDTLPDFRLLDTGGPPLPMEVFGRTDPAYQVRMRQKADHYNRTLTPAGWWHWNAFARDPLPSFPGPTDPAAEAL